MHRGRENKMVDKDNYKGWTGNKAAVFVCNGATGHAKEDREINDYYATDPVAGEWLLKIEPQLNDIWESACVDCDTEYFNGIEWKKISEYKEGERVLTFNPVTNSSALEVPIKYHKVQATAPFYHYKNNSLDMLLSKDHRVVYKHRRSQKIQVSSAEDVCNAFVRDSNGFRGTIPTTWEDEGSLEINETFLRLAVACNADGRTRTKEKKTYEIRVKKERKKERILKLLKEARIDYKIEEQPDLIKRGYFGVTFESPLGCKAFPSEWINLKKELKRAFIEEVSFWDGTECRDGHKSYFTNKLRDAELVQLIAASIGIHSIIREDKRRKNTNYCVSFKIHNNNALVKSKTSIFNLENSIDGYQYCFSVSTGMLILRRNYKIFVTGNCGEGHLAEVFRKAGKLKIISDLIDRGYHPEGIGKSFGKDFLQMDKVWKGDIVTNPPYACYDSETEVLTRDGWKYFKDIDGSEEILSCNINTQELEYCKIKKVIQKDVDEKLYHFSTPFLDLKVTADHRMFCVHGKKKCIQKVEGDVLRAKNVYKTSSYFPRYHYFFKSDADLNYVVIPGCYVSNGQRDIWHEEIRVPINDWLKFFGLWIADGCCRDTLNSQGNQRYTISIKQHEKTFKEALKIVGALPFKVKILPNKGRSSYNIEINSKQLWLFMSQFGKSAEKFIPSSYKSLPADKLKILLDSYMFGDCSHCHGRTLLRTVSKQLAEDLQEIILKLGSITSLSSAEYTTSKGLQRTIWDIQYHETSPKSCKWVRYGTPNLEQYRGKVYCVTLEKNGFMVVRRNKKISVSGNSGCQWAKHSLEVIEEGRYSALFMKLTFLEGKERKKFFAEYPPVRVWVSSSRIPCAKNGEFYKPKKDKNGKIVYNEKGEPIMIKESSAACYAWFVWQKGYKGPTEIKWFN